MKYLLSFLLLFSILNLQGQNKTYKNLVFEGAGIKGLAFAGALIELEERGLVKDIEKVGGTSSGAIISTAIAFGYNGKEMKQLISSMKFRKFNDGRYFFVGGFYRFNKYFGWYRGKAFENWIGEFIEVKTGDPNITFKELSEFGYKDLYITGTCLNKQELLIFSKETYPDMMVKDAVRASMSIPLYYKAVFIDSEGKIIEKPKKRTDVDLIIDGGIAGNFPIQIFDSTYTQDGNIVRIPNPNTLGLRIDTDKQIEFDKEGKGLAPTPVTNLKEYIIAFYDYTMESLNRNQLNQEDWERTISISSVGIGPKVKKLKQEEKDRLIKSGKKGVEDYFDK